MRHDVVQDATCWDRWAVVDTHTGRRYPVISAETAGRAALALERHGFGSEEATRALYAGDYYSAADLVALSGRSAGEVYGMILGWEGGDHALGH